MPESALNSRNLNIQFIGGGQPTIDIGKETYINGSRLFCWKPGFRLTIGNYCSIADGVEFILGGEHDLNWVSTYPFIERWGVNELKHKITTKCRGDISIGSDVWIGHGAIILSGTNIGDGAVIGAGAVVRGDIPQYSIAVGVPAKVIKKRFSESIANQLSNTRWWALDKNALSNYLDHLDDPEEFIREMNARNEN